MKLLPEELKISRNEYVVDDKVAICEGKAPFVSFTLAMQFCDKFECQGIHDEFCDGTSISACTTLNPPKDPMAQKHGCTYRKQGEELLHSLKQFTFSFHE